MHRLVLLFIFLGLQACAFSQTPKSYPDKPIHLVVPFQAGGAADQMARILAEGLGEQLKQAVWVEDRPGATGLIGTRYVARAAPDGYTLVVGHSDSIVLHGLTHASREPDPASGLVPVAFVGRIPGVLIARPGSGIASGWDLIRRARQAPGQITLASWGLGSTIHLGLEWMNQIAGIQLLHVPYGGTPAAIAAFYAGQVDLVFVTAEMALAAAQAGRARIVGASSRELAQQIPAIPWLGDQGFANLELDTWYGILAPRETAPGILTQLHHDINALLSQAKTVQRLQMAGFQLKPMPRGQFSELIVSERQHWQTLITERHIPLLED